MKKVLSSDGKKKEIFHYCAHDDTAAIQSVSDVSGILEANKLQRNNDSGRYESEVFNHVARVSYDAVKQWCKERGIKYRDFFTDEKLLPLFLNDPDNALWRTKGGKI